MRPGRDRREARRGSRICGPSGARVRGGTRLSRPGAGDPGCGRTRTAGQFPGRHPWSAPPSALHVPSLLEPGAGRAICQIATVAVDEGVEELPREIVRSLPVDLVVIALRLAASGALRFEGAVDLDETSGAIEFEAKAAVLRDWSGRDAKLV